MGVLNMSDVEVRYVVSLEDLEIIPGILYLISGDLLKELVEDE